MASIDEGLKTACYILQRMELRGMTQRLDAIRRKIGGTYFDFYRKVGHKQVVAQVPSLKCRLPRTDTTPGIRSQTSGIPAISDPRSPAALPGRGESATKAPSLPADVPAEVDESDMVLTAGGAVLLSNPKSNWLKSS